MPPTALFFVESTTLKNLFVGQEPTEIIHSVSQDRNQISMGKDPKLEAMEAEIAELDKQAAEPQIPPKADEKPPEAKVEEKKADPAPEAKPAQSEGSDPNPVERKVYTMPVDKHTRQMENLEKKHAEELAKREAEIRAEYDKKFAELKTDVKTSGSSEESDELIKKFAEENLLEEKAVRGLLELAEKRIGKPATPAIPKELLDEVERSRKEREIAEEKSKVEREFDEKVIPLIRKQYPGATPEHIQRVKESIQALAFTDRYHTYAVEDIYRAKSDDFVFQSKVSAEPSRGGAGQMIDYESVTDEQLDAMSPEEAEKYFAWQASKGSRYYS